MSKLVSAMVLAIAAAGMTQVPQSGERAARSRPSPRRDDASRPTDAEFVTRIVVSEAVQRSDAGQISDPNFDATVARPAYTNDRHPSVLFDEAHHNFHTTGGRYKGFADLLRNDGYRISPNREPFSASSLVGSEVLVIANALGAPGMVHPDAAKPAFTEAEADAVRAWVEAGGSLLLITDLPPFGASADILARRFGVDSSQGFTDDPANRAERGLLFSRANELIGDHPITRGRDRSEQVDRVFTFAGQSIKGPPWSASLLKFSASAVDRVDGNLVPAAGRDQGVAFVWGKGRVVVMGEAGQLSAQIARQGFPMGMNVPNSDNRKLALNTLHWLSRLID